MSVTDDTLKPLVDRLVSQPLQFKKATMKDKVMADNSSYIVIGNKASATTSIMSNNGTGDINSVREVNLDDSNGSNLSRRKVPSSLQEALQFYASSSTTNNNTVRTSATKRTENQDLADTEYQMTSGVNDEDNEGIKVNNEASDMTFDSGLSRVRCSDDDEEYYEAREHQQRDEFTEKQSNGLDQENWVNSDEDVGEEMESSSHSSTGDSTVLPSGTVESSSSTDEDYDPRKDVEKEDGEEEEEEESDGGSDISMSSQKCIYSKSVDTDDDDDEDEEESAALGSGDEAVIRKGHSTGLEAIEEDEDILRHKKASPNRYSSPTPPTTLSDISDFYQCNENENDRGTNKPHRIVKNWGANLSSSRPKGLLNHGVTCYQNAAIQAMLHIPALQHYLFDIIQGKYNGIISQNSVSQVFAETSKRMWAAETNSDKPSYINPKKLISRLEDINCMMSVWNQEDSHEYFMSLMSRLQEDSVPRGHKMTESIIYDIFGGMLQQRVECKSCGGVSITEQPIYDLSLHLKGKKLTKSDDQSIGEGGNQHSSNCSTVNGEDAPMPKRRYSIEKSIRDFFNAELIKKVDNKEGYVCEKCKATTNAIKRNMILRAPETLLVHLKKFRFNGTSSSKMKQAVSYPKFMDLTEYCVDSEKSLPVKYELIGVVVHEGRSLSSGHYIAHCKQPDGTWATYDDEYINKITERNVLKEVNAYYLVYTRLTPKAVNWTPLEDSAQTSAISTASIASADNNANNRKKHKHKSKKRKLNKN
ncbi:HBR519Cp [Eremothecium sinecaudum]|uniref:ubiquitinyl hydrolase 1 n=1 Tax=Eremothecium sinecaudum TaxID=45286 RepID=A0A109UVP3_9SACH|nr:HBR519Cp [Eremothecium sinecaudum]AMD19420.1 HBR519Cp [Eremothecium sinecaudum]